MRLFLVLLLCVVLAFQGGGSAYAFEDPCPMAHDSATQAVGEASAQALMDCCNDDQVAAQTGQLCKADTPCGSSGACVLPSFHRPILFAQAPGPVPDLSARVTAFDPSGVWRPPTLS